MDDHHGILIDTINELRLALMRGCGARKACELLDQLIEFMRMHFYSEEELDGTDRISGPGEASRRTPPEAGRELAAGHCLQYGEAFDLRPLLCDLHDGFQQHIEGWIKRMGRG